MPTLSGERTPADVIAEVLVFLYSVVLAYVDAVYRLFVGVHNKDVKDQVVLITGAGHGLGRELSLQFASKGAKIALVDINKENNKKVAEEIRSLGGKAVAYQCDITDEASIARLAEQVERDLGEVDILVNNAGIVNCVPFEAMTSAQIRKTFEVNTFAHFWTMRQFLLSMKRRRSGHIVAVSSIAGLLGTANLTDYCASKYALIGLMDALKLELRSNPAYNKIKLTTICPLAMTTGMFKFPKTRFAWIFPVIDANYVAREALRAILQNRDIITVPKSALMFQRLGNLMPSRVRLLLQQFCGYGVDSHENGIKVD